MLHLVDQITYMIFGLHTAIGCNGVSNNPSGIVRSPNYPQAYPNNIDCTYVIDIPTSTELDRIQIDFRDLRLEPNMDFLYYGVGTDGSDLSAALGSFTGGGLQEALVVDGTQMWFRFVSDNTIGQRGFNLTWTKNSPQGMKRLDEGYLNGL